MNSITNRSVLTTVLTVVTLLTSAVPSLAQTQPNFTIRIEKDEGQTGVGALQGQVTSVDIDLIEAHAALGEFRIVVSYPTTMLTYQGLLFNNSVLINNCGWDEIEAEVLDPEFTTAPCERGFIVIRGRKGSEPGNPDNEDCTATGNMLSLRFLLSNDRTLECQFAPVKFAFIDCTSNLLELQAGGLVWATEPPENPWQASGFRECNVPIEPSYPGQIFPTDSGYPQYCVDLIGMSSQGSLRLIDGGVDVICAGPIDESGDLNLDGLSYTLVDQALFERYFLYGDTVFPKPTISNPFVFEAVIDATDVNKDNKPLTVADLVYLARVIEGDATPYWGYYFDYAFTVIAYQITDYGVLYTDEPIGGAYVTLEGRADITLLQDKARVSSFYRPETNRTYVLILAEQAGSSLEGPVLQSGSPIRSVELSEPGGRSTLTKRIDLLPLSFVLYQNYPNPFNPSTTIEFALPVRSDYELTIFNAHGQQVETRQGSAEAGVTKIEWDGSTYASGVYLYKLEALGYEQTRKMLLLK